ncbi:MAG: FHA domain-containing protein, partial [Vicinamibacteria bacterium]
MTDSPAEDANVPTLTVSGGPFDGQRLAAQAGTPKTLGSSPESSLRLELGNVEATHASVVWDARGLLLSDSGTTTGT